MKRFIYYAVLILACAACRPHKSGNPQVEIQTKFGDIVIELYPKQAPASVAAFLRNVDAGYYENSSFYRVLNDGNQPSNASKAAFVQGGMWKTRYKTSKAVPRIPHENTQKTKLHHLNGTVSLARQEPGTAGTEFFIATEDQPGLDYGGTNNPDKQGYAAFGKVIKGMNIVYKIQEQPEYDQSFDPPVPIYKIVRL